MSNCQLREVRNLSYLTTESPYRMLLLNVKDKDKILNTRERKANEKNNVEKKKESDGKKRITLRRADWKCYVCAVMWSNAKEGEKSVTCNSWQT